MTIPAAVRFRRHLFLVAALLSASSTGLSQELPFTTLHSPTSSGGIVSLFQDRGGYLWLATPREGLLRYDGRSFIHVGELPSNDVLQVVEDAHGYLWAATANGLAVSTLPLQNCAPGAAIGMRSRVGVRNLPQVQPGPRAIAADSAGWIWGAGSPLWHFSLVNPDSLVVDTIGLRGSVALSVTCRRSGDVWASLSDGSFFVLSRNADPVHVSPPAGDTVCTPTGVFFETPGRVLYGGRSDGLLWKLHETGRVRELVPAGHFAPITAIASGADSALWVGTGQGIFICDTSMNPARTVPKTSQTRDLLLDREDNLWVARSGGLLMLPANYKAWTHFPEAGQGEELSRILPGPAEEHFFWVGASGPELCTGDSCSRLEADRWPEVARSRLLSTDENGRLWLAPSSGPGVFCLALEGQMLPPGSTRTAAAHLGPRTGVVGEYLDREILTADIASIPRDSLGERSIEAIWFAGPGALFCLADSQWFAFDTATGLTGAPLAHCVIDNMSRLALIGNGSDLIRSDRPLSLQILQSLAIQESSRRAFVIRQSLFHVVRSNAAAGLRGMLWSDGRYWLACAESVVVIDGAAPEVARSIPLAGVTAAQLSSVAYDARAHTIWLGTTRGLLAIEPDRMALAVAETRGMLDPELRSVAVDDDGALLCAHPSGVSLYRRWLDRKNAAPPMLHLSSVALRTDGFDVEWTAVCFRDAEGVRYTYCLAGYDAEWSPPTARPYTRYTNLTAWLVQRTYTFEVLAANGDGVWTSAPLRYVFTLVPAWYRSWWFVLLLFGLLLLALWTGIRLSGRKLRRRNIVLRRIVELQKKSDSTDR